MTDKNTFKLLELIKPEVDFDTSNTPSEPDYSNFDNWAALPDVDGQQFYVPDSSFSVNKNNNNVDVFYIHPTGFYEKNWNSDMDKKKSAFERTEIMLGNQVSAFNESCNIYAPEYRQATYYSFFDVQHNGRNALDLAYSDIESAFKFFIENFNKDKPFIIASHSQGALHALRLINQMIDNTDLSKRLVCAYVIGYIIPEKHYENLFQDTIKSSTFRRFDIA